LANQKSIDQEALAAVLARHLRTPVRWEQEPGVVVLVGAEGLARRLATKYAEHFKIGGRDAKR
jgi:hypothetical protein